MADFSYNEKESYDFTNKNEENAFVHDANTAIDLIQKEIAVNQSEQTLLVERIRMMREQVNDLPSSDPQYSTYVIAIEMDKVELDELKVREMFLVQKLQDLEEI